MNLVDIFGRLTADETVEAFQIAVVNLSGESLVVAVEELTDFDRNRLLEALGVEP